MTYSIRNIDLPFSGCSPSSPPGVTGANLEIFMERFMMTTAEAEEASAKLLARALTKSEFSRFYSRYRACYGNGYMTWNTMEAEEADVEAFSAGLVPMARTALQGIYLGVPGNDILPPTLQQRLHEHCELEDEYKVLGPDQRKRSWEAFVQSYLELPS